MAVFTEAGSLTSQTRVSTLPGPAAMLAAAALFFSALRPQIETLQPAAVSACAMPRPMPPLPPVMTATRPVRSKMFMGVSILLVRGDGGGSPPWTSPPGKSNIGPKAPAAQSSVHDSARKQMQFKHVTLDFDGPVGIVKLDHQEVMNAVSIEMLGSLAEALDAVDEKRAEVRCLVLTGAGRAFCTGANLQGRNNAKPGRSNAGAALETAFHPFLRRLRNLHCPIVTAVNGPAAGAGMSFALMGDMILCARSAYFLQAFRRIGLVPD